MVNNRRHTGNTECHKNIERKQCDEKKTFSSTDGRKNARLHSTQERAGEKNTAQNDIKQTDTAAEVPVIDENAALHAKEWVDNGSRL